jgi:flagellar capping protein FliD
MIGLKTNVSSGEFELDDEQFQKAMDKGFDEVVRLFTTTGSSNNTAITMGRNTKDTKSGNYNLEEVDATHYRIQLQGSSTWFQSDARTGDIVTFSDGLAKGLSLTAPAGSGSATFSFSKGLAAVLDQTITSLNDADEGLIFLKQESWKRGIKNSDQRVEKMQERVEKYRTRLVKQFSAMEQAISAMQSQGSQMTSAMSYYSS